ncbi:MAG TPA: hypothetical protein VFQ91_14955 [Bryobacteraceae bacterium]|nr:hypothetical protein [Bryobacteraceae bacterium]
MQPITHYFLGFDLGKDRDYSAIAVMAYSVVPDGPFDYALYQQPTRPVLDLVTLIRIPLGTEYIEVMNRFRDVATRILASAPWGARPPEVYVVIDAAGPGQIAVELIRRQQLNIRLVAALLTGGADAHLLKNGKVTVPRRDVLTNTRYLLESGALRIASRLKLGAVLEAEFAAVRPEGGQSAHDDLAIAAGLAAWQATRVFPQLLRRAALSQQPRAA